VFSIPNSFTPVTTILSSQVNANYADIATGLSNVLTRDNQAPMTAPLRLADGSLPLPGLQFANDTNTGLRRSATDEMRAVTGGADAMMWDAAQKTWALGALDAAGLLTAALQIVAGHTAAVVGPFAETQPGQSITLNLGNFLGARYGNNASGATVALAKSRGASKDTHTVVQASDTLASFVGAGSDGANFEEGGRIDVVVDGTPGADDMPGALVLRTTADGASSATERMAIRADGRVQIPNRSAPLIQLYGAGHLDLAEVAEPAAPAANNVRLSVLDEGGQSNLIFKRADGTVGKIRPATQTEMEAGTTNDVFVSPGRQAFHLGHAKATGRGTGAGATVGTPYNVSSISRVGAGQYNVTLANAMADLNYWGIAAAQNVGPNGMVSAHCTPISTTVVQVYTARPGAGGGSIAQDADFAFAVFGDM
jgi:hypothetical protein